MDTSTLRQELPLSLSDELKRSLAPGETAAVTLPGSFGEGIVVTDRRAMVMRERSNASGIDVFSHPLSSLTGAEAVSSSTGGYIELRLSLSPAQQDNARVYFPSYDLTKFQDVAGYINSLKAPAPAAAAVAAPAPPAAPAPAEAPDLRAPAVQQVAAPNGEACPGCGGSLEKNDVFCAHCGKQLRMICSYCQSASPIGSAFCRSCGMKMVEFHPACRSCGARTQRWMSFCPSCGAVQVGRCASCGMALVEGVQYCPGCGRQPGSAKLDGGAVHRARSIFGESNVAPEEPKPVPERPSQVVSSEAPASAEAHNQRGRELFEQELVDDAIREFEQAVAMEPNNASYHCNLAVAYDEADRDDDALIQYQKTLEIDPNDLTALLSLGYLHSEHEEFDKAQASWNKIIEIAPSSPEAQEAADNLRAQGQL